MSIELADDDYSQTCNNCECYANYQSLLTDLYYCVQCHLYGSCMYCNPTEDDLASYDYQNCGCCGRPVHPSIIEYNMDNELRHPTCLYLEEEQDD